MNNRIARRGTFVNILYIWHAVDKPYLHKNYDSSWWRQRQRKLKHKSRCAQRCLRRSCPMRDAIPMQSFCTRKNTAQNDFNHQHVRELTAHIARARVAANELVFVCARGCFNFMLVCHRDLVVTHTRTHTHAKRIKSYACRDDTLDKRNSRIRCASLCDRRARLWNRVT